MRVSIVIPTHNGMPRFAAVLDAIEDQRCDVPFDLFCVDTESHDGTWEELVRRRIDRRQISKAEFDHGRTRAEAIGETDGELVLLTVQDATPQPGWLQGLVDAVLDSEHVAAAYSRQVPYDDVSPFLAMRLAQWSAGKEDARIQRLQPGQSLSQLAPLERLQLCAFDDVSSIVKREIWQRHRVSHRRFGEDVAFGRSLIEANLGIAYAPTSIVVHSHDDGALAEFKRIYLDHANLHDLFDITTVPTAKDAWRNSRSQFGVYRRLIEELDPPEGKREELTWFALRYAFAETFGQWLGARSVRKGPPTGTFRWIERFVTS